MGLKWKEELKVLWCPLFVGGKLNGVGSGFEVGVMASCFGLGSKEVFGVGALADDFGNDVEAFIFFLLCRR